LINYDRLERILQHEMRSGCTNRAVINGLESFVAVWREQSLAQAGDDERARINAIASGLDGYGALETAQRQERLQNVLAQLAESKPAAPPRPPRPAVISQAAEPGSEARPRPPQAPRPEHAEPRPQSQPAAQAPAPRPAPPRRERPPAHPTSSIANLSAPVTAVRGVAAANALKLSKLGIQTVEDLLNY